MGKMTIQLPDPLQARLEQISRTTGRPVEEVASEMVEKAMSLERLRELRRELRPYAEQAGFRTDEDVFRAVS